MSYLILNTPTSSSFPILKITKNTTILKIITIITTYGKIHLNVKKLFFLHLILLYTDENTTKQKSLKFVFLLLWTTVLQSVLEWSPSLLVIKTEKYLLNHRKLGVDLWCSRTFPFVLKTRWNRNVSCVLCSLCVVCAASQLTFCHALGPPRPWHNQLSWAFACLFKGPSFQTEFVQMVRL